MAERSGCGKQLVKDLGLEQSVRPEGGPRRASQLATDATGELRGFRPVITFIGISNKSRPGFRPPFVWIVSTARCGNKRDNRDKRYKLTDAGWASPGSHERLP